MKIIGAIQGDVKGDFFHSLGDHEEDQHHAPADFDYDDAINRIQAAEAGLQQVPANTLAIQTNDSNIVSVGNAVAQPPTHDRRRAQLHISAACQLRQSRS